MVQKEALLAIVEDSRGFYRYNAAQAFGDLMSRLSGANYLRRLFSDQLTANLDPLAQISASVHSGFAVPLLLQVQRSTSLRSYAVRTEEEDGRFLVYDPLAHADLQITQEGLLRAELPPVFAFKGRAEAYLAPAALDLSAPPFGFAIPELGIKDLL